MKRLEIISLRASGHLEQEAHQYLRSLSLRLRETKIFETNIYVNAFTPGDLAIVISSQTEQGKRQKTDLGMILADSLKRFGLVDYTCWLRAEY